MPKTSAFLPTIVQTFGLTEVRIPTKECTFEKADEVAEAIMDYRMDATPLGEFKPLENETKEAWSKRVKAAQKPDAQEESFAEFIERTFKPKQSYREDAYATLEIICEAFGENCPSKENFDKASTADVRVFLYDILNLLELPDEAQFFRPQTILSPGLEEEGGNTPQIRATTTVSQS